MSPDPETTFRANAGDAGGPARKWHWPKALAVAAVAAAAPFGALAAQAATPAWPAFAIAVAAALLCGALAGRVWPAAVPGDVPAAPSVPAAAAIADFRAGDPRTGATLLASQVVPVWQRQLEASRALAEQGVSGLLESFSMVSTGLGAAVEAAAAGQGQLGAGSVDELLDRHPTLVDDLLEPVASLRGAHSQMQGELDQLAERMLAVRYVGKEMDSLARHARLVAMNAAIEANRAGQSQGGFGAVAREVLELSTQAGASAQRLLQRFSEAQSQLDALRRRHELDTGNDETAQLALRQRARTLIATLAGAMGQAMAGSRELREASAGLQQALDDAFLRFQFQDRFTQMMGSVTNDMQRFAEWLASGQGATHADAAAWLKRLDASYTMEEQRSHHHGTVQIAQGPAVEFF